jgi:hypothetical protein
VLGSLALLLTGQPESQHLCVVNLTRMTPMHVCVYLQALGIPVSKAQKILDRSKQAKGPTFIPKGSLKELLADKPSLPVQWPNLIHRFPLLQNTFAVRLLSCAGMCCGL